MALKWNNHLFFVNALEFMWAFGTKATRAKNFMCITP